MSSARLKRFSAPLLALIVMAMSFTASALDLKVDSSLDWKGYNNIYDLESAGGAYQFGYQANDSAVELSAYWAGPSNAVGPAQLVLTANTNIYYEMSDDNPGGNNTNEFWVNPPPNGPGNKQVEANFYVETADLLGQNVTFSGTVNSNSFVPGYETIAFVKILDPSAGWGEVTRENFTLPASGAFNIVVDYTTYTNEGYVPQYGFVVKGPIIDPAYVASTGLVSVVVENPDPLFTTQPVDQSASIGDTVVLTCAAVTSSEPVAYQWKKGGVPLTDGGSISGATSDTLTITGALASDSGDYTVEASSGAGLTVSATATVTVVPLVITSNPEDLRLQVGSTASFTGSADSSSPLTYRWFRIVGSSTNVLFDGGSISGATTTNLILSNVQLGDAASYVLRFAAGSDLVYGSPAALVVKTPEDFVNFLENPGFENGKTNESPWLRFESSEPSFGVVQDATDSYFGGGNVNVYEGSYVSFTTFNATWSGIYQDAPAEPGQIFTANMWFYNASGDPLPGSGFGATNRSYLEVQFRDAGDGVLQQYTTDLDAIRPDAPQDVWFQLWATNAGDFGGGTGTDGLYLEAPANTAKVRFQITLQDEGGSIGLGSLYYDSASLLLKIPVELTLAETVSGVDLSWDSLGATSYQVQYKDNLGDAWTDLEVVAGTGYGITRSYTTSGQRYYRVLTL